MALSSNRSEKCRNSIFKRIHACFGWVKQSEGGGIEKVPIDIRIGVEMVRRWDWDTKEHHDSRAWLAKASNRSASDRFPCAS